MTQFLLENENRIYNNWKPWTFINKENLPTFMLTLGTSSCLPASSITPRLWPDITFIRTNKYKRLYLQWSWTLKWKKETRICFKEIYLTFYKFSGNAKQYPSCDFVFWHFNFIFNNLNYHLLKKFITRQISALLNVMRTINPFKIVKACNCSAFYTF